MKCGIQGMILALLMLPLPGIADDRSPLTVTGLVDALAPSDGRFESRYRQTTASNLLSEPKALTGTIRYELPDRLRKTEQGEHVGERVIEIEDSVVRVTGEDGEQSFMLDNAPALQGLMTILHALASGNGKVLVDRFDGAVSGTWSDWSLQLRPELPAATVAGGKHDITEPDRRIEIRLEGRGDVIERLRIDPPRSGPTTLEFLPGETGS